MHAKVEGKVNVCCFDKAGTLTEDGLNILGVRFLDHAEDCFGECHDRDIPPQPSHTYSCPLAVQTPPEHSLTKPKPIPGLPDPSIAFPNSSAAFPKGCCTDVCLVSIPEAVNTIPEHI